jgi:hypothetical protein
MELFIQIMNEKDAFCTDHQLKNMAENDVKTYGFIRLTGNIDEFLPDKEYKN